MRSYRVIPPAQVLRVKRRQLRRNRVAARRNCQIRLANSALDQRRDFGLIRPDRIHRIVRTAARLLRRPDQFRGEKISAAAILLPMLAIGMMQSIFFAPYGGFASWHDYANAGPLGIPLPVRKPVEKLTAAVTYPPVLRVPPPSPLAFLKPQLPSRAPQPHHVSLPWRGLAAVRTDTAGIAYPFALALPERVLPPLPPLTLARPWAASYPLLLGLPPTPALALITPPIPGRPPQRTAITLTIAHASTASGQPVSYPTLTYAAPTYPTPSYPAASYPTSVTIAERYLPPLPKLARAAAYPITLALPPVPPLALITPSPPVRSTVLPPPRLQLATAAFPPKLTIADGFRPKLPKTSLAYSYPPKPGSLPAALLPMPRGPKSQLAKSRTNHASTGNGTFIASLLQGYTNKLRQAYTNGPTERPTQQPVQQQPKQRPPVPGSGSVPRSQPLPPAVLAALVRTPVSPSTHAHTATGTSSGASPAVKTLAALQTKSAWAIAVTKPPRELPFNARLISAIRSQMNDLTFYNADYVSLPYPMGDVPSGYGVCSDVIVRAYRKLGLDLQELVYRARVGSGDTNIDHRRTSVLRKFFKRHADNLPITDFAEDYKPGDIVSYHRPFGRSSKFHIAFVSDKIAPSGRPYVLHNRAWGVQEEDALFSDKITGHYRFNSVKPYPRRRKLNASMLIAAIPLPRRSPPRRISRRKHRLYAWDLPRQSKPLPGLPASRSPAPARTRWATHVKPATKLKLAKADKLSLCSPLQPADVRARMAQLCASGAAKAMALGGPRSSQ